MKRSDLISELMEKQHGRKVSIGQFREMLKHLEEIILERPELILFLSKWALSKSKKRGSI